MGVIKEFFTFWLKSEYSSLLFNTFDRDGTRRGQKKKNVSNLQKYQLFSTKTNQRRGREDIEERCFPKLFSSLPHWQHPLRRRHVIVGCYYIILYYKLFWPFLSMNDFSSLKESFVFKSSNSASFHSSFSFTIYLQC